MTGLGTLQEWSRREAGLMYVIFCHLLHQVQCLQVSLNHFTSCFSGSPSPITSALFIQMSSSIFIICPLQRSLLSFIQRLILLMPSFSLSTFVIIFFLHTHIVHPKEHVCSISFQFSLVLCILGPYLTTKLHCSSKPSFIQFTLRGKIVSVSNGSCSQNFL